eukprot:CAMPEP_0174308054 /NCGR_PEP_ID=MMETSP0810-20121108/1506_1 /TAXON_ID=73025 ORGANISM="Eutreptiella gymnastica-like, Strain CCMP1594" /NCGR_SAMPLE_ID=MMETSP0810 /ASSEMBLY_ACC=CAM_ASM_000659 /LENGTH=725 /DNA_ID=CAMNT_0015415263 /DNA_START=533 /DNA_END=2712 /DNA_ORIENTATION=-
MRRGLQRMPLAKVLPRHCRSTTRATPVADALHNGRAHPDTHDAGGSPLRPAIPSRCPARPRAARPAAVRARGLLHKHLEPDLRPPPLRLVGGGLLRLLEKVVDHGLQELMERAQGFDRRELLQDPHAPQSDLRPIHRPAFVEVHQRERGLDLGGLERGRAARQEALEEGPLANDVAARRPVPGPPALVELPPQGLHQPVPPELGRRRRHHRGHVLQEVGAPGAVVQVEQPARGLVRQLLAVHQVLVQLHPHRLHDDRVPVAPPEHLVQPRAEHPGGRERADAGAARPPQEAGGVEGAQPHGRGRVEEQVVGAGPVELLVGAARGPAQRRHRDRQVAEAGQVEQARDVGVAQPDEVREGHQVRRLPGPGPAPVLRRARAQPREAGGQRLEHAGLRQAVALAGVEQEVPRGPAPGGHDGAQRARHVPELLRPPLAPRVPDDQPRGRRRQPRQEPRRLQQPPPSRVRLPGVQPVVVLDEHLRVLRESQPQPRLHGHRGGVLPAERPGAPEVAQDVHLDDAVADAAPPHRRGGRHPKRGQGGGHPLRDDVGHLQHREQPLGGPRVAAPALEPRIDAALGSEHRDGDVMHPRALEELDHLLFDGGNLRRRPEERARGDGGVEDDGFSDRSLSVLAPGVASVAVVANMWDRAGSRSGAPPPVTWPGCVVAGVDCSCGGPGPVGTARHSCPVTGCMKVAEAAPSCQQQCLPMLLMQCRQSSGNGGQDSVVGD